MWNDIESLQRFAKLVPYLFIFVGFIVALSGQFAKTKIEDRVRSLHRAAETRRAEERKRLDQELHDGAAAALRATAAIEAKTLQRTLNTDQRSRLIKALASVPKADIEFECPADDHEAVVFANEVLEFFRSLGWNVTNFARAQYPDGSNPKGIEIGIRSTEREVIGKEVAFVFQELGFAPRVSCGGETEKHPLTFLIGSKQ